MTQMVRSRRQFVCSKCAKTYIKWWGSCRNCGETGTLVEKELLPPKPKASLSQAALQRRSKRSERSIARSMLDADGPDPNFKGIASSTGRVGHITELRFDGVSRRYATENKNRKMQKWLIDAWILINQKAIEYHKFALLRLDPPNMPKTFPMNGKNEKLSTLAVITEDHHEYLVVRNRMLSDIEDIVSKQTSAVDALQRIGEVLGGS